LEFDTFWLDVFQQVVGDERSHLEDAGETAVFQKDRNDRPNGGAVQPRFYSNKPFALLEHGSHEWTKWRYIVAELFGAMKPKNCTSVGAVEMKLIDFALFAQMCECCRQFGLQRCAVACEDELGDCFVARQ
jgi:hypothetical protein